MNAFENSTSQVDQAVRQLQQGAQSLRQSSLQQRIELAGQCLAGVIRMAKQWTEVGCEAKRTSDTSAGRAEEMLAGPIATMRFLQLTITSFQEIIHGTPILPRRSYQVDGQWRVPVFPTRILFDKLAFMGLKAECWLQPNVDDNNLFGSAIQRLRRESHPEPKVELVLGAGNVAAIPATDALTKIFHEDNVVLLKMNPVNQYLGPIFEESFRPLIDMGWLRIVYGDSGLGSYAVQLPEVQTIHITGSADSHEAIVWGANQQVRQHRKLQNQPEVCKPITSELGNVTPWIIVPGNYSSSQLRAQIESIAASIINNVSFNCVATKMIITSRHWPQREQFLSGIKSLLAQTPERYAYYPGATDRYQLFAKRAQAITSDRLPWLLRTGLDHDSEAIMFERESFAPVVGETTLEGDTPAQFLASAVEFVNTRMSGTLAISLSVPNSFQATHVTELDAAIRGLRYGTIAINQWSALGFAWMSTPWGGYPGATLEEIQSGIGTVHNTYLLDRPEKTVIFGKLKLFPKPVWFSNHRCPDRVAEKLFRLYSQPSILRLIPLFLAALRG